MTKTFKQIREIDVPKDHEYGPSSRKRPAGKRGYTSSDNARTAHLKTVKKWSKKKRRQGDKEFASEDFKAGDKVKYVGDNPRYKDKIGTIARIATGKGPYNHLVTGILKGSLAIAVDPKDLVKEEVKEGIKSQSHYDKEQEKIAIDTVKNPSKDLLSGPTSAEAEKVLRDKFGYTDAEIKKLKEESPTNATGSAVAGTGDDSSTVLVKKRKELQKRLMRRFSIKETLDRILPDPVETEDEITTRKNQLKELAKNRKLSEGPNDKNIETWSVTRSASYPRTPVDTHIVKTSSGKFKVLQLKFPGGGFYVNNVTRPSGKIGGYDDIDGARNHIKTLGKDVKLKELAKNRNV